MSTTGTDRAALIGALDTALRETSAHSVLFSQAVADRAGINATDLEALDLLARHGPMTAGRLAALTGLTTGAITGLVDRLERRGYARRERHPRDRRSVIIAPVWEVAEQDIGPSYAAMSEAIQALVARYSDAELAVILDFTERAAAIAADQVTLVRGQQAGEAGT